jgi:DNA-binding protein
MGNDNDFHVRNELDRVQLAARFASRPAELQEAVSTLALCVKGLMQSFGVHDIKVRASQIERLDGKTPGYVFEQLDAEGRTIKRAVVLAPRIETIGDGTGN